MKLWLVLVTLASLEAQDAAGILRRYAGHNFDRLRDRTYDQRIEVHSVDENGADASLTRIVRIQLENGLKATRVFDENNAPVLENANKKDANAVLWQEVRGIECPNGRRLAKLTGLKSMDAEQVDGRAAWIVSGQTKAGAEHHWLKLWVDQQDFACVKFEDTSETKRAGLFGGSLTNTKLTLEQARNSEGVWLPSKGSMELQQYFRDGSRRVEWQTSFSNFQLFRGESQVLKAP